MPNPIKQEQTKFFRQLAAGLAFFSLGRILPEVTEVPCLGAVVGIEGQALVEDILDKEINTTTFVTACFETGIICTLVGGSAATAGSYLFVAGFLLNTLISSLKINYDTENKTYHIIDTAVSLIQAVGTGIGFIADLEKKITLGVTGAISLVGSIKSLFYFFKKSSDHIHSAAANGHMVEDLEARSQATI